MPRAMASPIPNPPTAFSGSPERKNFWKTSLRRAGGIPGPSSSTRSNVQPGFSDSDVTKIRLPAAEYFTALSSRLKRTSEINFASARIWDASLATEISSVRSRSSSSSRDDAASTISCTDDGCGCTTSSCDCNFASSSMCSVKRFSRSVSSSITSSSSRLPSGSLRASFPSSDNRAVTEALIDVSGVRISCVTASSSADFKLSLRRSSSAWFASRIAACSSSCSTFAFTCCSSSCSALSCARADSCPTIRAQHANTMNATQFSVPEIENVCTGGMK